MTKMRIIENVSVVQIIFGKNVYQRQSEGSEISLDGVCWFVGEDHSWVRSLDQIELEAEWQAIVNPTPDPLNDEEYKEWLEDNPEAIPDDWTKEN